MATLSYDIETKYEKGDVVVFERSGVLQVGVITGYSVDSTAGFSVWYDIAVNHQKIYTYINGGDIGEHEIVAKISDASLVDTIRKHISG